MAALSYYSNWPGKLEQHFSPDMNCIPQTQSELLPPELLVLDDSYPFSDTCLNPLFEPLPPPDDILFSEDCTNLIIPSPSPQFCLTLNPAAAEVVFTTQQEFESFHNHAKHQKTYHETLTNYQVYDFTTSAASLYNWFVPNPPVLLDLSLPISDFHSSPPVYNDAGIGTGTNDLYAETESETNVKKASGGSLSAQSIAARQRRRKIAEKTQELGKLIPGGHKMNTAEMFQAAFKYIKFLQAQVGLLECMGSLQESEEASHSQEFQALIESPSVQEKLYWNEKCLAPKNLLQTLEELALEEDCLQASPMLLKHVNQLIHGDGQ